MSRKHAILAPSAASRWLTCSKSARLEETRGEGKSSVYADEGSFAHALGEIYIRQMFAMKGYELMYAEIQESEWWELYWNSELDGHCHDYAEYVAEKFNEIKAIDKKAKLILEAELDLTRYIPEGFGHLDVGIISNERAAIIDLKYGKGVAVDVVDNKQLLIYALGLLDRFEGIYLPYEIETHVFQPRIDNTDFDTITVEGLYEWAKQDLIPGAKLAYKGGDKFVAGTHCKFCNFRNNCKAYSDHALEIARYDFQAPTELTDKDIANILQRLPIFKNWASMIEEYALDQAVKHGKKWPGLKLVEGRSDRTYADEAKVEAALIKAKVKPDLIYQPRKLFGIVQMQKNLGKDLFTKLLNKHIVKPPGSPKLASIDDKRPELNSLDKAREDFA